MASARAVRIGKFACGPGQPLLWIAGPCVIESHELTLAIAAEQTLLLFPDDSKTGGGTNALPAIWDNKADFNARFAKFSKDVATAVATTKDEASFKKIAPTVFENCGGCHELYKAKSG